MRQEDTLDYFRILSKHRMASHYLPKFIACLDCLNHEQLWRLEPNETNSIGGIILHVMEHVRRNTARLSNSDQQFGQGIENHFPRSEHDKEMLTAQFETAFNELRVRMEEAGHEQFDIYNIYHLIEHTGYHLGQIVDRVQRVTGVNFQFVQNGINEKSLKSIVEQEWKQRG